MLVADDGSVFFVGLDRRGEGGDPSLCKYNLWRLTELRPSDHLAVEYLFFMVITTLKLSQVNPSKTVQMFTGRLFTMIKAHLIYSQRQKTAEASET